MPLLFGMVVQPIISDILDKIQNEAACIVMGLTRSVSLSKLYKECGWLSLAERRRQQKLSFMFKAHSDLLPTYISDRMPPLVRNISIYPLLNMKTTQSHLHVLKFSKNHVSRQQ